MAREGGLQFEVNLSDYLDTGLFLDHRVTRGMVREAGRRQAVPEPVRLHGLVHRLRGGGGGGLDGLRRSLEHLSRLGPAEHGPQRLSRPGPRVRPRRRHALPARPRPAGGVRPGRGRCADLLQQQEPGRLLGHPAEPRRAAQSARGADGARGDRSSSRRISAASSWPRRRSAA